MSMKPLRFEREMAGAPAGKEATLEVTLDQLAERLHRVEEEVERLALRVTELEAEHGGPERTW